MGSAVPLNVNGMVASEPSSAKVKPFMVTDKLISSSKMSLGSSEIEGVAHLMVVSLTKTASVSPKRPKLHLS